MSEAELLRQVKMYVARVAGMANTGHATSLGKNDQVKGRGDSKTPDPARRIFAYGVRSVPTEDSEGIVLVINGGRRSGGACVLIAAENTGQGPQDLAGGEVCLYSEHGQVVRLDKDGNVTVLPKAGGKVKLGDSADGNLDPVVLLTQLRTEFNAFVDAYNGHGHPAGALVAPMGGGTVTGSTGGVTRSATAMSTAPGSANVVAKK